MIALRSPGMMRRSTPRTACSPPKRFDSPRNSNAGVSVFMLCADSHQSRHARAIGHPGSRAPPFDSWIPAFAGMTSGQGHECASRLLAVFAGREVAAVDRLLEELLLLVLPELADRRIGLDHRVPELVLVV